MDAGIAAALIPLVFFIGMIALALGPGDLPEKPKEDEHPRGHYGIHPNHIPEEKLPYDVGPGNSPEFGLRSIPNPAHDERVRRIREEKRKRRYG